MKAYISIATTTTRGLLFKYQYIITMLYSPLYLSWMQYFSSIHICYFCCIFHCFENFPLSKLSHPITTCSSISRLYLSILGCPLILSMVADIVSPLKYAISPSFIMSQSLGSTVLSNRLICLMTFFCKLLLLSH